MESRPGHRASKSMYGIRTSVAVLPMAPFSPGRSEENSCRARNARGNWASISIPYKGAGFESQEPTSPTVSCIGQIKLKQKRAKESKEKPSKEKKKKMSKLKKFIFGSQSSNNNDNHSKAEAEDEEIDCTEAIVSYSSLVGYPSLGQIKRYTSGSYDAQFGDMFVQKEPAVVGSMSGPLISETVPPKIGRKEDGSCIWKRRSVAPPTDLEVCRIGVEKFKTRKPFTR